MNERHLARIISFQVLYQFDFIDLLEKKNGKFDKELEEILNYNLKEFATPYFKHEKFTRELILKTIENIEEIDKLIKKFAPAWPIKRISPVDRNILRIGIAELLFFDETPPKVAIDEAIELAKKFGSETSGRFVNGVLGTIYEKIKEKKDEKFKETREENKN